MWISEKSLKALVMSYDAIYEHVVSRCDVDTILLMYFVNSVRSHCTILMNDSQCNEDIDRRCSESV